MHDTWFYNIILMDFCNRLQFFTTFSPSLPPQRLQGGSGDDKSSPSGFRAV